MLHVERCGVRDTTRNHLHGAFVLTLMFAVIQIHPVGNNTKLAPGPRHTISRNCCVLELHNAELYWTSGFIEDITYSQAMIYYLQNFPKCVRNIRNRTKSKNRK